MQTDKTRPQRPAHVVLLTATDRFCARFAEPAPLENRAELFIRLLSEMLESDRLIRTAMQMNVAEGRASTFSNNIRADVQDALRDIGPLDCVQQMARHPRSVTN